VRRRKIPPAVLKYTAKLAEEGRLSEAGIGRALREKFPKVWEESISPRSIAIAVKRRADEEGTPIPFSPRTSGGKISDPNRRFPDETPELRFEYIPRLGIFSDVHCPYHNKKGAARLVQVIESREIEQLLWNGDQLDNGYRGHKGIRDERAATFSEGLHAWASLMDELTRAGIRRHIIIPGNHDDKPYRQTDGEITFSEFIKAKVWPLLSEQGVEWLTTDRYYAIMKPAKPVAQWPFVSENFPWRFTHQKNFSKIPLRVAKELASIHMMNIATGHQHHLARGKALNAMLRLIDCGTGCDRSLQAYIGDRDSAHAQWGEGFVTLENGSPRLWDFGEPDEWWERELA